MGSGTPQTVPVADITGLNCAIVFGSSPASRQRHAIFEVAIPLVVTGANPPPLNTDPAYFYSYLNPGKAGPFDTGLFHRLPLFDDIFGTPGPGAPPNFLGATGIAIGVAPTAGPLGPPPARAPPQPMRCARACRGSVSHRLSFLRSGRIMQSRPTARRSSRRRFLACLRVYALGSESGCGGPVRFGHGMSRY